MHPSTLPSPSRTHSPCAVPAADAPADRCLLEGVLDAIDAGLLVCDEHCAPQVVNAAAEHELASHRLLHLQDGIVRARGQNGLAAAIVGACHRGVRQVVALRHGDDRLYAVISPLRVPDGERLALVMLSRRNSSAELSLELLGISEGLTMSERRVLVELAAQRNPARIAHDREVALSTVRTQIGAVHAKLGVRSRQELLCLVNSVPSLAPTLRQVPAPERPADTSAWVSAA